MQRMEIRTDSGEDEIIRAAVERRAALGRPVVVALDGGSGVGKMRIENGELENQILGNGRSVHFQAFT